MTEVKLGAVCENQHIKDVRDSVEELWDLDFCDECGQRVYQSCSQCDFPIPVRRYQREDGTKTRWKVRRYCPECGDAYPWGPGKLGQLYDKHARGSPSESTPTPSGEILSEGVRRYLQQTKYGDEVVSHLRDGDDCYRHSLWFPALTMYIHAIEWAAISFLEAEARTDIIEQERNGVRYYLAGGQHSIVDELENHSSVDQKTISIINNINRVERRWVAHHKSGQTHRDDVDALRSRLETLVDSLFGPLAISSTEDDMDSEPE